jgi:hypothetical protein
MKPSHACDQPGLGGCVGSVCQELVVSVHGVHTQSRPVRGLRIGKRLFHVVQLHAPGVAKGCEYLCCAHGAKLGGAPQQGRWRRIAALGWGLGLRQVMPYS